MPGLECLQDLWHFPNRIKKTHDLTMGLLLQKREEANKHPLFNEKKLEFEKKVELLVQEAVGFQGCENLCQSQLMHFKKNLVGPEVYVAAFELSRVNHQFMNNEIGVNVFNEHIKHARDRGKKLFEKLKIGSGTGLVHLFQKLQDHYDKEYNSKYNLVVFFEGEKGARHEMSENRTKLAIVITQVYVFGVVNIDKLFHE